jgi:molybdopterin synthase catalytic subunit
VEQDSLSRGTLRQSLDILPHLQALCKEASSKWEVIKIAMVHRIGHVGVGEASVIIAISSSHRKASLEAVSWAIDELKLTVPIWKLEVYEDGSQWKENPRP